MTEMRLGSDVAIRINNGTTVVAKDNSCVRFQIPKKISTSWRLHTHSKKKRIVQQDAP